MTCVFNHPEKCVSVRERVCVFDLKQISLILLTEQTKSENPRDRCPNKLINYTKLSIDQKSIKTVLSGSKCRGEKRSDRFQQVKCDSILPIYCQTS